MALEVGIVGLPNSGKSTLFNALLQRQVANVASYPFTTIKPNVGIVEVPDERLQKLAELIRPEKVTPAAVKFIDIAGLVKNAHKGEGLGNQFLAKIRECDAIVHLIRGFENKSAPHYYGSTDPQRDKKIVEMELELAGIKKPTLYVLNISQQLSAISRQRLDRSAGWRMADKLPLADFEIDAESGAGVDKLIKAAYKLLELITFYTVKGEKEVTAWSLKRNSTALEAAGKVHTDMAKGFIKAEVIGFKELVSAGGWKKAKSKGKIRLEGRDYLIQDGDVVEFKFSR